MSRISDRLAKLEQANKARELVIFWGDEADNAEVIATAKAAGHEVMCIRWLTPEEARGRGWC